MPLARTARTAGLGGLLCLALSTPALSGIVAQIDQSRQRMRVFVNGALSHEWPVSTARRGYVTPNGSYRVGLMAPMWRSHKYHNSPMPHAMFFRGGYAIHGTYSVGQLGNRASHGCIRLSPGNASRLFGLARTHGGASVVIRN